MLLTLINFYYAESDPFAGKLVSLFIMSLSLAICFLHEQDVSFAGSEPNICKLHLKLHILFYLKNASQNASHFLKYHLLQRTDILRGGWHAAWPYFVFYPIYLLVRLLMANQLLQVVHLLLDYLLTIVRRSSMQVAPLIVNILTNEYLQKALLLSIQCPDEVQYFSVPDREWHFDTIFK